MADRRLLAGDPTTTPVKHTAFSTGDRIVGPDGLAFGAAVVTRKFYIDRNRADAYTEDGSSAYPWKTIQAAINKVIANGDNHQDRPYEFEIASGIYPENLVLEHANLVSLIWKGRGSRLQVQIKPASGLALQSMANNANFYDFHCENIQFSMPTTCVGAAAGNYFGFNWFFENCYWPAGALATWKNMTYPSFFGDWGKFSGGVVFSNITQASVNNIGGYKTSSPALTIETDEAALMPYAFGAGTAVLCSNHRTPDVTWSLLNIVAKTGTALQLRACRHGSSGGTIPVNATILAYHSSLVGNYVVNGTLTRYSSFVSGTVSGPGTITRYQPAENVGNDSTVAGTTVKDALDTLKAGLPVLSGAKFTADGGLAVLLKNWTASTIPKGSTVKADTANDDGIVLTALSDLDPIGIAAENIAAGATGWVVTAGRAEVLIDNAGGCTREQWLGVSTATAGMATAAAIPVPPTSDSHFREVGHTLRARGTAGLVFAIVHFN
jgi:hypothetical protein